MVIVVKSRSKWQVIKSQQLVFFSHCYFFSNSNFAETFPPESPCSTPTASYMWGMWNVLRVTARAVQPRPPPPAAARCVLVRKQRSPHRSPLPVHQGERWLSPWLQSRLLCSWAGPSQKNISAGVQDSFRSRGQEFPLQSWEQSGYNSTERSSGFSS